MALFALCAGFRTDLDPIALPDWRPGGGGLSAKETGHYRGIVRPRKILLID